MVTCIYFTFQGHFLVFWGVFNQFLSDPGIPGVRSMGPSVCHSLREVVETTQVIDSIQVIQVLQVIDLF